MTLIQQFNTGFDNERHQQLAQAAQAMNQKHIERADDTYLDLGHIHIFNVGPEPYVISMGGLGMFLVPGCPEDRPYSEPLKITKLVPEGRHEDMQKMIEKLENGYQLAESIVGYGKFCNPASNMTKKGIFTAGAYLTVEAQGKRTTILASEIDDFRKKNGGRKEVTILNTRRVTQQAIDWAREAGDQRSDDEITEDILAANLPTEEEVLAARRNFTEWCLGLVAEANDYFRAGNHSEIQKQHRFAAIHTNNKALPWVRESLLMAKCGVCANPVDPDAAICGGCRAVLKPDVVIANRLPGYEHLWKDKAPAASAPGASSAAAELNTLTKAELARLAFEARGLKINPDDYTKPDLVALIEQLQK